MMNPKKRQRLNIQSDGLTAIVGLEHIEIWDGADLALLREVLSELIQKESYASIGVDLQSVKYIPSGFFGMLYEWYESGIKIQLRSPQPNVEQMLWFRMFFAAQPDGSFTLNDEAVRNHTPGQQVEYHRREFTGELSDELELTEDARFDIEAASIGNP
ncbi:MAG: hypothetical protein WAO83_01050 [Fuerstiella sp.]